MKSGSVGSGSLVGSRRWGSLSMASVVFLGLAFAPRSPAAFASARALASAASLAERTSWSVEGSKLVSGWEGTESCREGNGSSVAVVEAAVAVGSPVVERVVAEDTWEID